MTEWRVHGGRLHSAQAAFPHAPAPWIDLSTGINPQGWDAAQAGPIGWGPLPEDEALRGLEAAAAAFFRVDPRFVLAVPGTEIGLRLLRLLALPAPHRHSVPSYSTHDAALGDSSAIALDQVAETPGGTLLLANPNNPDGRWLSIDELRALATDRMLVIDEAFADSDPALSVLPRFDPAAMVVLRSFGKFFGLAGLRLGFVIAGADRLAVLRDMLGSWPVSAAAITIGTAAYRDGGWIAATRARLTDDAAALDAVLVRHGLSPAGRSPLFRLVRTDDAAPLFDRLARAGILTRPFDHAPGWLRIGLPADAAALARLDAALPDG